MAKALPDAVVTTAGTPITIAVLANDEGAYLTITSFSNPAHGNVTYNLDKSFTYTPVPGFVGNDGFSYTVRDIQGAPASAEVSISVMANNGTTVATDDIVEMVAGGEAIIPVLANDLAAGNGALELVAVSTPGHGTVKVLPDQTIRYVPQAGFVGIDSFTYTAVDEQQGSASATVTIKILAGNGPPFAKADSFAIEAGQPTLLVVLANDSDPDGGPLQIVGFTMPSHGKLVFNADKTFSYTPDAGYLGLDQFTYTIRDNRGASATAEVALDIVEITEPPVAVDDSIEIEAGQPVTIDVLANDSLPADQEINIIALTLPYRGTLVFNADKTITYTPNAGFVGIDDFAYTIGNGKGDTSKATVTVEVTAPAEASSYVNGYAYRRRIVVPASAAMGATHMGFPLWLELSGDWLKSVDSGGRVASPSGHDLRFELEDGTKLPHEIERYDAASGRLDAWVRLPELSAEQATTLLLYYGKPGQGESEADPAPIWQDYLAVWHLPDATSAGEPARTLLPAGTVEAGENGAEGAITLNGDGVMTLADAAWLSGHAALTVQLRSKAYSTGHDHGLLNAGSFSSDAASDLGLRYQAAGWGNGQPSNVVHGKLRTSAGDTGVSSPGNQQQTGWQSIAVAWQSGDGHPTLYIDGAASSPSFAKEISGPATTLVEGPLHIGAGPRDTADGGWIGSIDEVRFCSRKLNAAWLAAEHANLTAPALLYGLGTEETVEETGGLTAMPLTAETESGRWVELDVVAAAVLLPGSSTPEIQSFTQPEHGIASVIGGKIRYAPSSDFVGEDGFSFILKADGKASQALTKVRVKAAASGGQGGGGTPNATYLRTVAVANATQLASALSNAQAGDDIVLADGTYNGSFELAQNGTAANPIRVRASNAHQAVLTGRISLSGNWGVLWQLQFDGGWQAAQIYGEDCRVSRCRFRNTTSAAVALKAICRRPQIDYNYIESYDFRGISGEATSSDYPRNPYIHHNHLKTQVSSNGGGIIMGEASAHTNHAVSAIIEYNLVDGFNGIEPLSAKSSRNVFRFNTVKNADGVIMCRHGTYNDYIGNASINAGGVMLHGRWNRAIGNYHDGAKTGSWRSTNAASGTVSQSAIQSSGGGGVYPRAEDCLFAGNIGPLIIGGGAGSSDLPPLRTIIEEHQGPLSTPRESGTIHRPLTVEVPPYVVLNDGDVGPSAGLAG